MAHSGPRDLNLSNERREAMKSNQEKSNEHNSGTSKDKEWTTKVFEVLQTCQDEIKKTTVMGKKMLSASKTNSCLHESYEELGKIAFSDLDCGQLEWGNSKVPALIEKINQCHQELALIEKEMNKVKFASGPEPITPKENEKAPKQE
jgi:hypothetical protein